MIFNCGATLYTVLSVCLFVCPSQISDMNIRLYSLNHKGCNNWKLQSKLEYSSSLGQSPLLRCKTVTILKIIIVIPVIITISRTVTIFYCHLQSCNYHWMVTVPRTVTIPRMVTNSTDQTQAPQLLFRYCTSSFNILQFRLSNKSYFATLLAREVGLDIWISNFEHKDMHVFRLINKNPRGFWG